MCSTVTPDVTNFVTGSAGCEFSKISGNDSEAVVNDEAFFGGGWSFLVRDNNVDGVDTGVNSALKLVFTGGNDPDSQMPGQYSFTADPTLEYMLVFKGGNINNTLPGSVIGYLLTASLGTYISPLLNDNNLNPREISHISLYAREGDNSTVVPLPAAAWLLLTGLAGLGFIGRRRAV